MTKAEINLPGQPFNASAKAVSPSSILVSWSRPEHGSKSLKEYKLFYKKDSTPEEQFFITKHTEHEITDLSPYTKYSIWVVAYNQNGPGMNSLEVVVVTNITTADKLKTPINLKTNVISPNAIDITTILYVMIACCLLLIFCIGIEMSLLCCKTLNVITLNK
ncbi:unnamed protein product [Macrosiphum euphorbiae]|uniref:Fibronectin type-III domain-containing protein n=1 Tax=Macrosiphum euphorbiae TaxID=13131 RepID=A0AAV0WLX7_9HEMI|nr:unnamed protein product [Macrosiphum euphorbiae]